IPAMKLSSLKDLAGGGFIISNKKKTDKQKYFFRLLVINSKHAPAKKVLKINISCVTMHLSVTKLFISVLYRHMGE
ncbi:MAG: hypothetical protein K2P59_07680, partial [Acetatifactor sp.]|nr:hypothetical protein [Acetatifactor sp.]